MCEREGGSKKKLKGDKVKITDKDRSEGLKMCMGDHAGKTRPKLLDLNPFLICNICKGYLVSATTITNCLHSCTLTADSVISSDLKSFFHQFASLAW